MPTAAFANLGCKVNQYEIEKIAESFAGLGFEIGEFSDPADVYVINTCSVTSAADRKSRHMARKAARQKDGARVVITGCFAQMAVDTGEAVDGASLLVPNREKMRVAELTLGAFPELIQYTGSPASLTEQLSAQTNPVAASMTSLTAPSSLSAIAVFPEQAGLIQLAPHALSKALTRTRATLKVQDGCEHFCAFCSIPYTRNTMASRSLAAVVDETRAIAAQGVSEVVVTGVCVGAYEDGAARLPELLRAVADVDGIERVRLSSIQPIETDELLIDVLATHPNICPHLHLSLQSGDDGVLKDMQRPYDTSYFRNLVHRLRARVPHIAITTDIIVGFPGETDERFANTLAFAREMAFSRTHVFRYSPRQRTYAADNFRDNVPDQVKEARHKALTAVCAETQANFARTYIGQTVPVMIEGRGNRPGYVSGYTDTYVRVYLPGATSEMRTMAQVAITGISDDGELIGERA